MACKKVLAGHFLVLCYWENFRRRKASVLGKRIRFALGRCYGANCCGGSRTTQSRRRIGYLTDITMDREGLLMPSDCGEALGERAMLSTSRFASILSRLQASLQLPEPIRRPSPIEHYSRRLR